MRAREWESVLYNASLNNFFLWLFDQPEEAEWARKDGCCCPLHDFIQTYTGVSLFVNSPELMEHWSERPTQEWPTPRWMHWILVSTDHSGTGPSIGKAELSALALLMVQQDFEYPIRDERDWTRVL